jgi:hypothetical protein
MMENMSKRSTRMAKRNAYQNELRAVEEATGSSLAKNSAAPALGRPGGSKGGKARAENPHTAEKKK